MSYKSEERNMSMEEQQQRREREQAMMEEFIKNKGIKMLPPDERIKEAAGPNRIHRPNGRRIIRDVFSIDQEVI